MLWHEGPAKCRPSTGSLELLLPSQLTMKKKKDWAREWKSLRLLTLSALALYQNTSERCECTVAPSSRRAPSQRSALQASVLPFVSANLIKRIMNNLEATYTKCYKYLRFNKNNHFVSTTELYFVQMVRTEFEICVSGSLRRIVMNKLSADDVREGSQSSGSSFSHFSLYLAKSEWKKSFNTNPHPPASPSPLRFTSTTLDW